MSFPCIICQYVFKGDYLWNIHGDSMLEDRHLLCTRCLVKFSHKNAVCPLKCHNIFNPMRLNPGYKSLISKSNKEHVEKNPSDLCVPDDEILKNQKDWDTIVQNIEKYITVDTTPYIYGFGKFCQLTCYMYTLKSIEFEDKMREIITNTCSSITETLEERDIRTILMPSVLDHGSKFFIYCCRLAELTAYII